MQRVLQGENELAKLGRRCGKVKLTFGLNVPLYSPPHPTAGQHSSGECAALELTVRWWFPIFNGLSPKFRNEATFVEG
jgi:hypothetical protein